MCKAETYLKFADRLAHLVERRTTVWEDSGSIPRPGRGRIQGEGSMVSETPLLGLTHGFYFSRKLSEPPFLNSANSYLLKNKKKKIFKKALHAIYRGLQFVFIK